MGKGYDKHPLKTIAAIIAAVIVLSAVSTFASYRELELFDQAYEYYLSYQPEKALDSFALFMNEFPKSPAKDAAMFWMGKSMLSLKRTDDAKSIFKKIKQDFPSSPLRKYADKELEKLETADEMMSTRAMITEQDNKYKPQTLQAKTDNATDVTTPPHPETPEMNDKRVSEEATGKTGKEEQLATAGITIASQIENYESQILQAKTGNATNVITPSPSEAQEGNDKQVPEPSSGTGKKEDKEREPASSVERLEQQSASDVPLNGNGSSVEALNTSPSVQANKQNNPESETEVFLFLSRYTGAYERGDIAAFLDLFSKDAVENNSLSYSDIRQFYARNFKASRYRYALENVVIEDRGDSVIVGGNYRIMSADGVTLKAHGFIQWALTRNEGSLKIMRIDYEKK